MSFPQIHQLSADDVRKIYPNKYYKKYAYHQKVMEHEVKVLHKKGGEKEDPLKGKWKHDNRQSMPNIPQRRQYNPLYQDFQSTIELNKQQIIRLNKFNKALKLKLQLTPEKKPNQIRSPLKDAIQASQHLLLNLKAIEDLQNEKLLKQKLRRKRFLDQKSFCKFSRKIKSTQITPIKTISPMQTDSVNPQIGKNILTQIIDQHEGSQLKKSKIRSKARFLNLKLVTNFQKKQSLIRSSMKGVEKLKDQNIDNSNRRDLLQQTRKIRNQVTSMETLSLYQAVLLKKKRKQLLNQL